MEGKKERLLVLVHLLALELEFLWLKLGYHNDGTG